MRLDALTARALGLAPGGMVTVRPDGHAIELRNGAPEPAAPPPGSERALALI